MDRRPAAEWINALRTSHARLAEIVLELDGQAIRQRSYASEWSVAQVLSHLGSAAEIFQLFLSRTVDGGPQPVQEDFRLIWDRWDAKTPESQVADSIDANESYLKALESLDEETVSSARLQMFGRDLDIAGMVAMRLAEHVVHSWDVAVVLDPSSRLPSDAVDLVIDTLPDLVTQFTAPSGLAMKVRVQTTHKVRDFLLAVDDAISLRPAPPDIDASVPHLQIPGEAFVRLLYGRLDDMHTPMAEINGDISTLRRVFSGF